MILDTYVTEVADHGDELKVVVQGKGRKDADWRRAVTQTFTVANTEMAQRAFFVGRKVRVEITAV